MLCRVEMRCPHVWHDSMDGSTSSGRDIGERDKQLQGGLRQQLLHKLVVLRDFLVEEFSAAAGAAFGCDNSP